MGYRGDDLDLRTPHAASGDSEPAAPAPRRSTQSTARGTIWVDDTALECCNHAFDVAAAHRAPEVRLEHLIYALTRNDEAADAFERRSVRVAALRREAATVIATEIPAAPGNGKTNPRRAEAFEEVLRLAAAHAYRRQAPVAVDDIVYALLDTGIEVPSLIRLFQQAPRSIVAPGEASLDIDLVRERVRNGGTSAKSHGDFPNLGAAQTGMQNNRIDAIEHSIRTLTTELSNERKILSGVLQDLQRELMAQREDTARLGGITHEKIQTVFGDRLQSLEQAFMSSRPGDGIGPSQFQDRLLQLERSLHAEIFATRSAIEALSAKPAIDLGALDQRIEGIGSALAAERERATAGEQSLASAIQSLAQTLDGQPADLTQRIAEPLGERIDTLAGTQEAQHGLLSEALAEAQRRVTALEEQLAGFVARAAEAASAATSERDALRDRLELVSTAVEDAAESSRTAFSGLTETLTQDLSDLQDGVAKTHGNHELLASALDSQADDLAKAFAMLVGRIDSLEKSAAKPVEMLQALSITVEKMHKLTVERYYRRNRFWYWLFGTDDWLAASWPSQSARIEEELRSIKH